MTIILAIDTSLAACSAALLLADGKTVEQYIIKPREHTALILPMINTLLADAQLALADIDAIAFGCGPASFTGIRIAASIAQGLAFAHKLPVIPISSLQAIAQAAYREKAITHAMVVLDAHMSEVYSAAYTLNLQGHMVNVNGEHLCIPAQVQLPETADLWYGVGDGWRVYKKEFEHLGLPAQHIIDAQMPHARDIALLAQYDYQQGKTVAAVEAMPVYLRDKSAWKKA